MLSLILPTYNEAANIAALIDHIDGVLQSVPYEIIVVDDDSPDGTWRVAEGLVAKHPALRVLRRMGKRGLSSAVIEGFDLAQGNILAVMDADGQHDAALLHKILSSINAGAELSIGSRYVSGGSVGEWVRDRRIISSIGTTIAKFLSRVKVSDPLGGFFALRSDLYKSLRSSLRPTGFKILLEILAHVPPSTRVTEIPLVFRMRLHGRSKLSLKIHVQFVCQVLRLAVLRTFLGTCRLCSVLFWTVCVIIFCFLAVRAWHLRLLFADAALRTQVQTAVSVAAAREGWLLSDIEMTAVDRTFVHLTHREHMRRVPAPVFCTITITTSELSCAL